MTGPSAKSIFRFQRQLYNDLHDGRTSLYPYQYWMRGPCRPSLCQYLFIFLMTGILAGVRKTLSIVLICVFLVAGEVEHFFFIYLFAIVL